MSGALERPATIRWEGGVDGQVLLIDQTLLPTEIKVPAVREVEAMWEAIKRLRVRGAPAIGVAAAYGVMLAAQKVGDEAGEAERMKAVREATGYLATSRPTAVNLFWALKRMEQAAERLAGMGTAEWKARLLNEAEAIRQEDAAMCRAIGRHGEKFIAEGAGVMTHCNAGGLATAEYGTALAVLFTAHEAGKRFHVFVDETRPLLQGARLTAWELMQAGIDCTLICDNMAAMVMQAGQVQAVITGADRIAANGDAANKIGTYGLAVLAKAHGVAFYVAAPTSTFDMEIDTGAEIPIEERGAEEVAVIGGKRMGPEGVKVYNPAFDVTGHELITAIITERGVIERPDAERVRSHFEAS